MRHQLLVGSVEAQVGLRFNGAMRARLDRYVRQESQARGLGLDEYAKLVHADAAARQALVDLLVVPTTSFFRHPEQFAALGRRAAAWEPPVTVWSAGCSTGQEPYSVAMLLAESALEDWRVVGSDVSTAALERAASGLYHERELAGLDAVRRRRHLERAAGGWRVAEHLRARTRFVRHNLVTQDVPREVRGVQAVLCRNVLIYMAPDAQRAFLDRVATQLPALDVLVLGATESLWGATERFDPLIIDGSYLYRPVGAPARAERAPAAAPSRRVAAPVAPSADAHLAMGEAALAAGDTAAAVAAFRRASYLDADSPLAHFHLGAALELAGAGSEARRAYAVALAALRRRGAAAVEVELQGFTAAELIRIIEARLGHAP